MKKFISIMLTLLVTFSLAGCNSGNQGSNLNNPASSAAKDNSAVVKFAEENKSALTGMALGGSGISYTSDLEVNDCGIVVTNTIFDLELITEDGKADIQAALTAAAEDGYLRDDFNSFVKDIPSLEYIKIDLITTENEIIASVTMD